MSAGNKRSAARRGLGSECACRLHRLAERADLHRECSQCLSEWLECRESLKQIAKSAREYATVKQQLGHAKGKGEGRGKRTDQSLSRSRLLESAIAYFRSRPMPEQMKRAARMRMRPSASNSELGLANSDRRHVVAACIEEQQAAYLDRSAVGERHVLYVCSRR